MACSTWVRRSVTTASASPRTCSTRATTSAPRRTGWTPRVKPASTGARCRMPKATSPSRPMATLPPTAACRARCRRRSASSPARPRPRSCEKATCGAPASTPTESCTSPAATSSGGGVDAAYVDTPDGSALSVDVEGSYTRPGVGTVGGSLGYDRIETSDGVTEHYEAGGYASGYGVQVEAGVEGTSVTTADGTTTSDWDVSGDVSGGVTEFAKCARQRRQRRGERRRHVRAGPEPPATEYNTQRSQARSRRSEASVDDLFGRRRLSRFETPTTDKKGNIMGWFDKLKDWAEDKLDDVEDELGDAGNWLKDKAEDIAGDSPWPRRSSTRSTTTCPARGHRRQGHGRGDRLRRR